MLRSSDLWSFGKIGILKHFKQKGKTSIFSYKNYLLGNKVEN